MSNIDKSRKPTRGKLSDEDRALWDAFSKAVSPAKAKQRVPAAQERPILNDDSRETSVGLRRRPDPIPVRTPTTRDAPKMVAKPIRPAPRLPDFDRKTAKKLSRGRLEIDARIDLHGLRQTEAHTALRGFINRAIRNGCRTVLVITGKGGDDATSHWKPELEQSGRGILRRSVPLWLSGPEFRDLVVSFTMAHVRHGGDGAFYVQLRRSNRGPSAS
jgi:DNA-nicking Smr family endonuclease